MTMARRIGHAAIAGVALAVLVGVSGCNARERIGDRSEPVQQVQQPAGQSLDQHSEDATTGREIAEIDALLAEIDADLRQTDLDLNTEEGDVQ